jgi:transcriptional regulator with XRE-family HTH domain
MPTDLASLPALARQLHDLRRTHGWSQPELASKVGISAAMIGRYERGEMMPPADALAKLAQAFGVTMDHLYHAGGVPQVLQDKAMLDRWAGLNDLAAAERDRILSVLDALVRDAKTRRNYGGDQRPT